MGGDASKFQQCFQRRPRGLVNFGSTCYFNATMAALMGCGAFEKQLEVASHWPLHDEWAKALFSLCLELARRKGGSGLVSPKEAFNRLTKLRPEWTVHDQQDAHEFLNFLLNHLDECHQKQHRRRRAQSPGARSDYGQQDISKLPGGAGVSSPPSIVSIFEGSLAHVTRCLSCDCMSTTREKFFDLTIPMAASLEAALRELYRVEFLKASERYSCEGCQQPQNAVRFCWLAQIPQVVVFQLKRFRYEHGNLMKIQDLCQFPMELELEAHNPDRMNETIVQLRRHLVIVENGNSGTGAFSGFKGGWNGTGRRRKLRLCACVCHIGPFLSNGHYIAIVASNERWWAVDDEEVTGFTAEQMAAFCAGTVPLRKEGVDYVRPQNVYMLFYQTINHPQ
eukprot:Protomagalhaensia_sp_Gyna_25__1624@NODE_183_length_4570_cov_11_735599_g142_i0_p2_GENE_NODE_183_length_4570_cov_11_735599_g142_i0NODE_183_length_4570_cov_11_735599_g142_i0_p2_ORF_typecomplete_len393_score53_43UCH/PF00443_29/2_3e61UCH_1/PF13423_6/1_5e15_NODE_183_length_4570_cov_11_735599_g142_i012762454